MARLFISHSVNDSKAAIHLRDWLVENGWDDVFLDLDPERGIAAGSHWQNALRDAAHRCEAILFLISPNWLASRWCLAEYLFAKQLGKRCFPLLIERVDLDVLPPEMAAEHQVVDLRSDDGWSRLKIGLIKAGVGALSFVFPSGRRPYPGLEPLTEDDAAIFLGRDAQIASALDELRLNASSGVRPLFVILGASGAGKSSLLRAGLLPRLKRDDRNFYPLPTIRPADRALSGMTGLWAALETAVKITPHVPPDLPRSRGAIAAAIHDEPAAFIRFVTVLRQAATRAALIEDGGLEPMLVLAVDQAEELYNAEGRDESKLLLDYLGAILRADRRTIVIMAIRSDQYPHLQQENRLPSEMHAPFNLAPMDAASFKDVIEGPAHQVGLTIEPELVNALVADSRGTEALPLLAFTLERLYTEFGASGTLRKSDYDALGGVTGAISAAIEDALSDAPSTVPANREAQLELMREAFIPQLVRVNDAGEFSRRVAKRMDITSSARPIVDLLIERHILTSDRNIEDDVSLELIEIAHEALLRNWPLLVEWLEEERAYLTWREQTIRALDQSNAGERGLLMDRELSIAKSWLNESADRLEPNLRKFIETSIAADEKHKAEILEQERALEVARLEAAERRAETERLRAEVQERRNLWLRRLVMVLIVCVLFAFSVGIGYWNEYIRIHIDRYSHLEFLNGAPFGRIHAPDTNPTYRIVRRGRSGPVVSVSRELANGACAPFDASSTLLGLASKRGLDWPVCRINYVTGRDGKLISSRYFDAFGADIAGFLFSEDSDTGEVNANVVSADGSARAVPGSLIAKLRLTYSKDGRLERVIFQSANGKPHPGRDGAYGFAMRYDQNGFETERITLGPSGDITRGVAGFASIHMERDSVGRIVTTKYMGPDGAPFTDSAGVYRTKISYGDQLKELYTFGPDGEAVEDTNGCQRTSYSYDVMGNEIQRACFGKDGKPATFLGTAYHRLITERNESRRVEHYQGIDDLPALEKDLYATRETITDNLSRPISVAYFDIEGKAARNTDLCHRLRYRYDNPGGQANNVTCFNESGAPRANVDGVHETRYVLSPSGVIIETEFFDRKGEPIEINDGWHREMRKLGGRDEIVSEEYFDAKGHPTYTAGGYHRRETRYDTAGHIAETAYFGIDAKKSFVPVFASGGYHLMTQTYDDYGRRVETAFFDSRRAAIEVNGYHRAVETYDSNSALVRRKFLRIDGEPAKTSLKVAASFLDDALDERLTNGTISDIAIQYDPYGHPQFVDLSRLHVSGERSFLLGMRLEYDSSGRWLARTLTFDHGEAGTDENVNLAKLQNQTRQYDRRGRLVLETIQTADQNDALIEQWRHDTAVDGSTRTSLSTPDGKPLVTVSGYHSYEDRLDEAGHTVMRKFFDADGKPVLFNNAYHEVKWTYNNRGYVIMERYYKQDGEPGVLSKGGIAHGRNYERNLYGDIVSEALVDIRNDPVAFRGGFYKARYAYNPQRQSVRESFFDARDEPMAASGGYHQIEYERDDAGHISKTRYLGIKGERVLGPDGYHERRERFDTTGRSMKLSFFGPENDPVCVDVSVNVHKSKEVVTFHAREFVNALVDQLERSEIESYRYFDSSGYEATQKLYTKRLARQLLKRPLQGQFREQLFWLVDTIYMAKTSGSPTLEVSATEAENAFSSLNKYLETGDASALDVATSAVERFAKIVKRWVLGMTDIQRGSTKHDHRAPCHIGQIERERSSGILFAPLYDKNVRQLLGVGNHGVIIAGLAKGSPGKLAGLRVGDVLLAVGDTPVQTVGQTVKTIAALWLTPSAGGNSDKAEDRREIATKFRIMRDREERNVVVLLSKDRSPTQLIQNTSNLAATQMFGSSLKPWGVTSEIKHINGIDYTQISVMDIKLNRSSEGERAKLLKGDLLLAVKPDSTTLGDYLVLVSHDGLEATYVYISLGQTYNQLINDRDAAFEKRNYSKVVTISRHLLAIGEAWSRLASESNKMQRARKARLLGDLAFYLQLTERFIESEKTARKALTLNPDDAFIKINLAHALLLQGKLKEARKLYLETATVALEDGKLGKSSVFTDFQLFYREGLIIDDTAKDYQEKPGDMNRISLSTANAILAELNTGVNE